jgi:hypothetical protein
MKKKLKLSDLQVRSFVTEVKPEQVKGGEPDKETLYSCLQYITCDFVRCYFATKGVVCTTA